jgi:hypothetical protein
VSRGLGRGLSGGPGTGYRGYREGPGTDGFQDCDGMSGSMDSTKGGLLTRASRALTTTPATHSQHTSRMLSAAPPLESPSILVKMAPASFNIFNSLWLMRGVQVRVGGPSLKKRPPTLKGAALTSMWVRSMPQLPFFFLFFCPCLLCTPAIPCICGWFMEWCNDPTRHRYGKHPNS